MAITELPTPPSRSDTVNFPTRGDNFLAALPVFATEANALQADVNSKQAIASSAATAAATSQAGAAASATTATTQATTSTTQATASTTQAAAALASKNAAATSETNALTSKNAAATSATGAATSATGAATSATTATTQASSATTSAATATTQAGNASTSATAAAGSATGASGSATTATTQAANASTSASGAATSAATATTQAGNASTSAAAATTSATNSATSAANAALSAAALTVIETLPTISKSIHSGAVVKTFLYDTGKDSDGGAWRKRCQDKSWYTEALGFTGTWRNQLATTAAAWAVSGAAAGDGFQNTTDGKYYVLTGTTTASEVFRGSAREFPEQVAVVAETSRVVIYDLTQVGTPMWMVFLTTSGTRTGIYGVTALTALSAMNGDVCTGGSGRLSRINFLKDYSQHHHSSAAGCHIPIDNIAGRNNAIAGYTVTGNPLVSVTPVNDIAMTILDGAPVDPATGLPVPTIAVATAGGVSVIKHDGVVVNSANTSPAVSIKYNKRGGINWSISNGANIFAAEQPFSAGFATTFSLYHTTIPATLYSQNGKFAGAETLAIGGPTYGVTLLKENPTITVKSMVAYLTNAYNSGWIVGDIRGAWLADTVAETITASGELVANGTFATDTSGWTVAGGGTAVVSAGAVTLTTGGSVVESLTQSFTTVVGKTYLATCSFTLGTITGFFQAGTAPVGMQNGAIYPLTTGAYVLTFVATATTTYISYGCNTVSNGLTTTWDNISVKLASPDRSVKNNGLVLNGALIKAAVAAGAQLIAYSGFSASNYLEQPYNAALEFTGDFCIMGWAKSNTISASTQTYISLIGTNGKGIQIGRCTSSGVTYPLTPYVRVVGASATLVIVGGAAGLPVAAAGAWDFLAVLCVAGISYLYVNGVLVSTLGTAGSIATLDGTLKVGAGFTSTTYEVSTTLWRATATAPSADQIAHIYRTELPLFQANAKCTIDGTSTAVTALAYDDATELLQVGTTWGRSAFKDLLRVESEATAVGAITSIAANQGAIVTGGTSARFYQPAMLLRDELRRKEEARKAFGKVVLFFDFDAITSQTAFVLPKGYTAKAVYSAESLKREGATKTYTRSNDGFAESINFAVAPGNTVWVSIMCVRA